MTNLFPIIYKGLEKVQKILRNALIKTTIELVSYNTQQEIVNSELELSHIFFLITPYNIII